MQRTDERRRRKTPHLRRARFWPLAVAALMVGGSPRSFAQDEAQGPSRPVVGIALGGGSARGMAHGGVLQWL